MGRYKRSRSNKTNVQLAAMYSQGAVICLSWADLNTDPLVIFLWKLTGSKERERKRRGKHTRSNPEFGNECLCAANFLIKERGTTSIQQAWRPKGALRTRGCRTSLLQFGK